MVTNAGFDAGSVLGEQSRIIGPETVRGGPAVNRFRLPVIAVVPQMLEDVNGTRASARIAEAPVTIFEAKVYQVPDDIQHATCRRPPLPAAHPGHVGYQAPATVGEGPQIRQCLFYYGVQPRRSMTPARAHDSKALPPPDQRRIAARLQAPGSSPCTMRIDTRPGLVRLHLAPTFGTFNVQDITEQRVCRWRKSMLDAGTGQVTVAKAYRLLQVIMATAVDDGLIRRNPCRITGAGQEKSRERGRRQRRRACNGHHPGSDAAWATTRMRGCPVL